jgi:hypothetical protein
MLRSLHSRAGIIRPRPNQKLTRSGSRVVTADSPIVTQQPRAIGLTSAVPPPFNTAGISRLEWRRVFRVPEQLRLHPALDDLGWNCAIDELNQAAQRRNQSIPEPVLITTNGTILAGFGRWRLALFEGEHEIHCIEYPLSENDSLQFILTHHQTLHGWNPFVRIRLALTLEPCLQERALENMRVGGRYKGWANLPDVQRIDVRKEVAKAAAVGPRNVTNVKTLLKLGHPRLIKALTDGTLTINGAMQLCKLPQAEQLKQFIHRSEERAISNVIRRSIASPKQGKVILDVGTVLGPLQQQEARYPGSVVVQVGRLQHTVILIGQDLLTGLHYQKE